MSIALFLSMIATVVLSFFIPILFCGRFGFKRRGFLSAFIIGAGSYLIYSLVISRAVGMYTAGMNAVAASLIMALIYSLGLTLMVYVAYKLYSLAANETACCFAVGAGQALAESALLVGIAYINNIFFSILIMNGTFEAHMLNAGFDTATIEAVETSLVSLAPSALFLSAFERMFFSVALIAANVFFAKKYKEGRRSIAFLVSIAILFVAYLIPSLLSLSSDKSLVYVIMSILAIFSLAMVYLMGRRTTTKLNASLASA